jgi:hypothetical protein
MLAPKALQASVRTVRSQPAVQWILELDPSSSQELLNGKKFEPLPQLNFRDPQAVRLVQLLQTEVEKGSRTGGLFGETVGNSLILYLAEHYPTATTGLLGNVYAAQENGQGYASILVDEITIYAHLELDVVLAELSDEE